jgi:predicted  nucleic acid-binding Zn-ribbon protein
MCENDEDSVEEYDEEEEVDINTESKHEENSISLVQHGHYTNNVGNTYNNFVMGYHFLIVLFLF